MTHGATHGPEFMTSLVSCVDAILKQGKLSVHEAIAQVAKEHNAKLNTVRRAYSRAQVSKERAHGNQLLSDNQEYSLCGIILAFASAGISISRQDLIKIIRTQFLHDPDWQGDTWVTNFLNRRSQWIGARSTQALDVERKRGGGMEAISGL
jgi:hypothetical protein